MADAFIQGLTAGHSALSGVFSIDLSRIQLKFAPGCDNCLDYWLRFAVFYGAREVRLDWTKQQWQLEFAGNGPDLEEMRSLLVHPQLGARYLGMGVVAALAGPALQVVLETGRARVDFDGHGHQVDSTRRLREALCRLTVKGRLGPPKIGPASIPVVVNGKTLAPDFPQLPGLSLLLHGAVLPWNGPPLLPPDYSFQYRLDHARLDLMLRHVSLSQGQIEDLQAQVEAELLAAPRRSLAQLEWLQLRMFSTARFDQALWLAEQQPAPPVTDCFAAAHYERQSWLNPKSQELKNRARSAWVDPHWTVVMDSGLLPPIDEPWLLPTYRQFRGRLAALAYRRILRRSWGETGPDGDFLQALWGFRRDTLGGNYLLAGCLLELPPTQVPRIGAQFCLEFLFAAEQEAGAEMAQLSERQRLSVAQRAAALAAHLKA